MGRGAKAAGRRGALQDSGVPARLQLLDHVAGGLWAQARFKTLNPWYHEGWG